MTKGSEAVRDADEALETTRTDDVLDLRGAEPVISLRRVPLVAVADGPYLRIWKRPLDVFGALILILVLLPVIITVSAAVRLSMGSGVVFRQERVGRKGRVFRIVKFRTMRHPWEIEGLAYQAGPEKTGADPRHTRVGRFLRSTSLDELPQLWNVLRGDMSLVGPRPEMVHIASREDIWYHPRHAVRPGITGPWQVSADRSEDLHQNLGHDINYVRTVSLRGDSRLLLQTIGVVLLKPTGR
ncbi:MAG: sugar transferase [Actinomycetia bacterium]|nr:sugar transferase [Actinomycetes bacterium]